MLRYAARAVPWQRVLVAAALAVGLMELVRRWPGPMWALEPAAVGLLAGAAAWCFDEPSAAVVDTAPRGIGWRTAARGLGVVLLLALWIWVVWHSRKSLEGRADVVAVQGLGAMLAGCAWSSWRRGRGSANPGTRFAVAVVPLGTVWALAPTAEHLPLFPALFGDGWETSQTLWLAVAGGSVALLALAMTEAPWWRAHWNSIHER